MHSAMTRRGATPAGLHHAQGLQQRRPRALPSRPRPRGQRHLRPAALAGRGHEDDRRSAAAAQGCARPSALRSAVDRTTWLRHPRGGAGSLSPGRSIPLTTAIVARSCDPTSPSRTAGRRREPLQHPASRLPRPAREGKTGHWMLPRRTRQPRCDGGVTEASPPGIVGVVADVSVYGQDLRHAIEFRIAPLRRWRWPRPRTRTAPRAFVGGEMGWSVTSPRKTRCASAE